MANKYFTIYDHVEKSMVYDKNTGTAKNGYRDMKVLKFKTPGLAQAWIDADFASGNYFNKPSTVYEIKKTNQYMKSTPQFTAGDWVNKPVLTVK